MRKIFTYNKFACFTAALATMFVLSSCGDDDDDNNTCNCDNNGLYTNIVDKAIVADEKDVMVNWLQVSSKEYMVSGVKATFSYELDYIKHSSYFYIMDGGNGLYGQINIFQGELEKEFYSSWKYNNGYIYMYDTYEVEQYAIISLTSDEMVLRRRTGDETIGAYEDRTYKRINGSIDDYIQQKIEEREANIY